MEGRIEAIEGLNEIAEGQGQPIERRPRESRSATPTRTLHFPLVTLSLAAFQIIVHQVYLTRPKQQRCASVATILDDGQWSRFVSASFDHTNGAHLAVNLISFVWKGMVIESAEGSLQTIPVIAKLILLVGVFNTLLSLALYQMTSLQLFYTACIPTFSGVLVALKVINQRNFNSRVFKSGNWEVELPPPPWSWLELLILHLAYPDSVLPIVSGLLVGFFFRNHIINLKDQSRPISFKAPHLPSTYLLTGALLGSYFLWPGLDSCVSFRRIFDQKRWLQLLLPSLYTFSTYHLTYVALSLLSLGYQMEPCYGPYGFAFLVTCTACYVNLGHCLIAWFFSEQRELGKYGEFLETFLPPSPRDACYSGLTGALLSLKVLLYNQNSDADYDFASFKMAVPHWFGLLVELIHLHIYTPKGWILGHIAGVLVGLALVHTPLSNLARI
ncbi:hypothetical protein HPB47_010474 [Ixodes persulcatus]|uniref:Uncharacterized protein n=1 Tax=Ixodes persulcatus TaxID=34615 RepID=A0AC60NYZ0_IXOPE|nr:hypothetical protein HPB47_010474 [Ixodes persulcatus]